KVVFSDSTTLASMKRRPEELVEYLYRETSFPDGCILLTGTGIVPPDTFTLQSGDEIAISIDGIGALRNMVEGAVGGAGDLGVVHLSHVLIQRSRQPRPRLFNLLLNQ